MLSERISAPTKTHNDVGADMPVSAVTASLIDQLTSRDRVGRAKYGTSLDRGDLSLEEWLQHMTEELLDGAGYAQAAKRTVIALMEAIDGICEAQPVDALSQIRAVIAASGLIVECAHA